MRAIMAIVSNLESVNRAKLSFCVAYLCSLSVQRT
jgi:hypothetical protein